MVVLESLHDVESMWWWWWLQMTDVAGITPHRVTHTKMDTGYRIQGCTGMTGHRDYDDPSSLLGRGLHHRTYVLVLTAADLQGTCHMWGLGTH